MSTVVVAIDLGATSGRVCRVDLDSLRVDEVHRFATPVAGARWDWTRIVAEVHRGLDAALERGPAASIGIDTWGVDYGLLDSHGDLVAPPFHYRHPRTAGWRVLVDRIGAERLYAMTGIQLMSINTLFQLAAHDPDELSRARELLMLPELAVRAIGGTACAERTSAGTTQLVDTHTADWSDELIAATGAPRALFGAIDQPGTWSGTFRGVPIHLVGGHDTASAVVAVPDRNAAFVSLGTWALVGVERAAPDCSEAASRANFSNEPGVAGTFRFLKNVAGMWLIEELRRAWGEVDLDAAGALPAGGPVVDAADERFLAPDHMEAEIRGASGLGESASRAHVVRCAVDSITSSIAGVFNELRTFADDPLRCVRIVGGGSRSDLMCRLVADATGLEVRTGPAEATALGNAMVQGVAVGRFASIADARAALAASL